MRNTAAMWKSLIKTFAQQINFLNDLLCGRAWMKTQVEEEEEEAT